MNDPDRVPLLIADDHAPTRAMLRDALDGQGFTVVATVGDAASAVRAAVDHDVDVCLLDISMPNGGGIWAAHRISEVLPKAAIVMFTVSSDEEDLFESLRAGASGYLVKGTDPARLPYALRGVLSGEAALPRNLVKRLVEEFRERGTQRRITVGDQKITLTTREWEVLELMRQGLTTGEMARALFVSAVTVRTHVASIVKKLHVDDRGAAVRMLEAQRRNVTRRSSEIGERPLRQNQRPAP